MSASANPEPVEPLQERLSNASERLRDAVNDVIARTPIAMRKPAELERVMSLDRSLSSRVLRAVDLDDPLAALHRMPGPQGVRLLLKAARSVGVAAKVIDRADAALTNVERIVAAEVGQWKDLEVAISGWLPDAREQFDLTNRQAAFRAMSNLKGITADAELSITFIHPGSASPDWVDRAGISGVCRMQRLRPGTPMGFFHASSIVPPPGSQRLSLDGQEIDPIHEPPLLREFCSDAASRIKVLLEGERIHYVVQGDDVGLGSRVDLFLSDVMRGRYPATKRVSPRPATPGAVVRIPVKTLIVDVLVHKDVWPGVVPELRLYDTSPWGIADVTDRSRDVDRIDCFESIQDLGTQLERFRLKEVARYVDMVRFVCDKLGWEHTCFRGFRCQLEYPVYGTHVSCVFEPP